MLERKLPLHPRSFGGCPLWIDCVEKLGRWQKASWQ
jgi:hypothetical protein